MSLVIHYWIGDVQDSQGVSVSQNANYNFKAWYNLTVLKVPLNSNQSSAINQSSALSAEFHSRPRMPSYIGMPSYIVIIDADIQLLVASEDAN